MNSLLRIITCIFLLLALATLTGIAQTTATLVAVEAAVPCCPHEKSSDETPFDLPGCTMDCHCSVCQGVDASSHLLLLNASLETRLQAPAPLPSFPSGHRQAIDYPPETA